MNVRALMVAAAVASVACIVGATSSALPSDGTLELAWTFDGKSDPDRCAQMAADELRLTLTDARGGFFGDHTGPCTQLVLRAELPTGSYGGSARLVDSGGAARSTTVALAPFKIENGATLHVAIDFPVRPLE